MNVSQCNYKRVPSQVAKLVVVFFFPMAKFSEFNKTNANVGAINQKAEQTDTKKELQHDTWEQSEGVMASVCHLNENSTSV